MKTVIGFTVAVVVLSVTVFVLVGKYLDRPTVEISVDTGLCYRAYGPKGAIPCEEAMGMTPEIIYVDPIKKHKKM